MFTKVSAPTSGGIIVLPEVETTGVSIDTNLYKWIESLVHGMEEEAECQWSECEERDERRFIPSTRTITHLPQQFMLDFADSKQTVANITKTVFTQL